MHDSGKTSAMTDPFARGCSHGHFRVTTKTTTTSGCACACCCLYMLPTSHGHHASTSQSVLHCRWTFACQRPISGRPQQGVHNTVDTTGLIAMRAFCVQHCLLQPEQSVRVCFGLVD